MTHRTQIKIEPAEQPSDETASFDYSKLAFPLPDNQTFVECMSGLLKYMHEAYDQDPNLKGLLIPPAPVVPSQKPRKKRRTVKPVKLGDEEEEIIKQEEREEFERVLESQLPNPEVIKPLAECQGTKFEFRPNNHCDTPQQLMMILLQYQSFKSYPYYTDDEKVQQEQIQLQKQRRHELMKQKRAIRRERRKEMKMKRGLGELDSILESRSKRTKYDDEKELEDSEIWNDDESSLSGEEEEYSNSSFGEDDISTDELMLNGVEHTTSNNPDQIAQWSTTFENVSASNHLDMDIFLTPTSSSSFLPGIQYFTPSADDHNNKLRSFDQIFEHQLINQRCFGNEEYLPMSHNK